MVEFEAIPIVNAMQSVYLLPFIRVLNIKHRRKKLKLQNNNIYSSLFKDYYRNYLRILAINNKIEN